MANYYYVDGDNGDDGDSGEIGSPWQTIEKANQTAIAGDQVIIREGTYNEPIDPDSNGLYDAEI